MMSPRASIEEERESFGFASVVRENFAFLEVLGFEVIESCSTLVRYKKGDLEVSIYHGRRSYEIGFEIMWQRKFYTIGELIRFGETEKSAFEYRNYMATTPLVVKEGLQILAKLAKQYGERALGGDTSLFSALDTKRKAWAEEFALDTAVRRLRPEAEAAFRRGDYKEAARIYEEISPRLTPAELRKLEFAKRHPGG